MRYVDEYVLPVSKKNLRAMRAWPRKPERSGWSTARWKFENAQVTISR
jgi:hypothetical protein